VNTAEVDTTAFWELTTVGPLPREANENFEFCLTGLGSVRSNSCRFSCRRRMVGSEPIPVVNQSRASLRNVHASENSLCKMMGSEQPEGKDQSARQIWCETLVTKCDTYQMRTPNHRRT